MPLQYSHQLKRGYWFGEFTANILLMDEQLQELRDILQKKSLWVGHFTLSSGGKSTYYLDCRTITPFYPLLLTPAEVLDNV